MPQKIQPELWHLAIPLPKPLTKPGETITHSHVLLALLRDREGHCGIGYSRYYNAAGVERALAAARGILALVEGDLGGWLGVERLPPPVGTANSEPWNSAASALSLAAWDLVGQQRGVPCADLWGAAPVRRSIESYASGLFMDTPIQELVEEAREYRKQGYRSIKLRIGHSLDETCARVDALRAIYPEPRSMALEVINSWDVAATRAFLRRNEVELLWLEDPVPYEHMGELLPCNQRVAAGEVLETATELVRLHCEDEVPLIIIDVQAIGGPLRFLECARVLHALGAVVGSHRFPHHSIHLLACLPESLPVEMVDWANPALRELPNPGPSSALPVMGPGFGTKLNVDVLERYGRQGI